MTDRAAIPTSDVDLYTDEALAEPYGHYRALRDQGPVVWLSRHEVFAVSRYADVRDVLERPAEFCSGQGVGLNAVINAMGQGTTLMTDGDAHRRLRSVVGRPLTPSAVADLRPEAAVLAGALADRLVAGGTFDAVTELAEVLPATWVPDLLGWPADGRDRLLAWAAATFDSLGPDNDRTAAAGADLLEMVTYAQAVATTPRPAGSMAAGIQEAVARGDLDEAQCPFAIVDYLGPSLDTTVAALGNAIWLFARHPDQWAQLRREPERLKQAFNEVLRLETPISGFTRVTTQDAEVDGVVIPEGARVLVGFASANRDERRWDDPEAFDITRNSAGHVGFGHGEHACVGMGLARLEGAAVLGALAERVAGFELVAPAVRKPNNLIRSFASLPIRILPA